MDRIDPWHQAKGWARTASASEEKETAARRPAATAAAEVRAAILLALACIHEFSWQAFPWVLQGQWRAVTQWLVIAWLALSVARLGRDKFLSAACLATTIMSSTTAICSAAWLISPWQLQAGKSQCSQWLSFPMMLVSALVAAIAMLRWKREQ